MRIMRFRIVFLMRSCFSGLGSFWVSFGVSREPLLESGGTHLDFSWATWRLLGCLGWPLGSLGEPCGTNLGFSWVTLCLLGSLVTQIWATLSHLGSDLASFGYLVCESSFLPYLWMPLVEFVGIGEAGLDLCQCVSIGTSYTQNQMHTRAQLTCTRVHVDPLHDMRACCNKLLKTIRFESDNGRFNKI